MHHRIIREKMMKAHAVDKGHTVWVVKSIRSTCVKYMKDKEALIMKFSI